MNIPPQVVNKNQIVIDRFSYLEDGEWKHTVFSNGFIEPDGSFVEKEYHAARALYPIDQVTILRCKKPFGDGGSKQLGRAATWRPDWEEVKYQIMMRLVMRKFLDHPQLAKELLATDDALLIEGNVWHDNIWGDCQCSDLNHPECAAAGLNLLGHVLMSVREAFKQMK